MRVKPRKNGFITPPEMTEDFLIATASLPVKPRAMLWRLPVKVMLAQGRSE